MAFPSKTRINVGAVTKRPQDLSSQTITSLDFGGLIPIFSRNVIPDDNYNVDLASFVRTAPMLVPTFGRVTLHVDTFFVPYFMLWHHWDEFYSELKSTNSVGASSYQTNVPYFLNSDFADFWENQGIADKQVIYEQQITTKMVEIGLTSAEIAEIKASPSKMKQFILDNWHPDYLGAFSYDYTDPDEEEGSANLYYLTNNGKRAFSVLRGLGYDDIYTYELDEGTDTSYVIVPLREETKYNAFRLLAYFKVVTDWYHPSQFVVTDTFIAALEKIKQSIGASLYIDLESLEPYFMYTSRCYDDDLYNTSAVQPNSSVSNPHIDDSVVGIPEQQDLNESVYSYFSGIEGSYIDIQDSTLTHPVLSALSKLQEYAKRRDIGGHRAIDRYLSEFGVKSESVRNTRSVLVHSFMNDVQISDVISTASTDTASLGEYAGKGVGYEASRYKFETNDFGVLISIASIVPTGSVASGVDLNNLDVKLSEQFIPEFDQLGFEALPFSGLKNYGNSSSISGGHPSDKPAGIFGFVPRYAHMKVGKNILSGDFRVPSLNDGMDAWHLYRNLERQISNDDIFRMIDTDDTWQPGEKNGGYDRIFEIIDTAEDHFYLFFQFNVTALRPMLSLTDEYDLDHPDDGQSHKQVTMDYRGKTL